MYREKIFTAGRAGSILDRDLLFSGGLIRKLVILIGLAVGVSAKAGYYQGGRYKVTVVNLTKGQPLTPMVAVHAPKRRLINLGKPVSDGLAALFGKIPIPKPFLVNSATISSESSLR